jgi:LmbE family N-acetylglucosaminyl deacetylase
MAAQLEFAGPHEAAKRILLVSPHLDDALLSVGGLMAGWRKDKLHVHTLFAGDAPSVLSKDAQRLHRAWGLGTDAPASRRKEDAAAWTAANITFSHGHFPEALYRGNAGVFDPLNLSGEDGQIMLRLEDHLREVIATTSSDVLLGPQGIGSHKDHVLTSHACRLLAHEIDTYLWVDQPYAWRTPPSEPAPDTPIGERKYLSKDQLDWKLGHLEHYKSQMTFLFDTDDWTTTLRNHGQWESLHHY